MTLSCRKTAVRESAAQWNLDALVSMDSGEPIPCFFSVVPTWCTFQTVSSGKGERLLAVVSGILGPPSTDPQVVKGGSCDGGEDESSEFAYAGAMISVTWDFLREEREPFIRKVLLVFAPAGTASP